LSEASAVITEEIPEGDFIRVRKKSLVACIKVQIFWKSGQNFDIVWQFFQ
jgi:hypothetical protein